MIELAGARWLAPAFGSGLEVWASLLTVTLLSIALGAWGGGWAADRWPGKTALAIFWAVSAAALAWTIPARHGVLGWTASWGPAWGALASSTLLYMPALVALSAVPPLCVRLSAPVSDRLGRTVGFFSAVGTLGSCLGALATGFVLVPHFPIPRLFAGASIVSLGIMLALLPAAFRTAPRVVTLLLWAGFQFLVSGSSTAPRNGVTIRDERQSLYGYLQVVENGQARFLFLDGILQGGVTLSDHRTLAPYTSLMESAALSAVPHPGRVLVIGLGSAVLPERFRALGARVETVEIDPQVAELARRWFDFSPGEGDLHVMDGRRFLDVAKGPYDLIFLDAFSGEAVPGHLLTVEAFRRCRELLSPEGAVLLNYVGNASGPSSRVPGMVAKSLGAAFPSVSLFASGDDGARDNLIFVGRGQSLAWGPVLDESAWPPSETGRIRRALSSPRPLPAGEALLTDDWHPVDWLDRANRLSWREEAKRVYLRAGLDSTAL